MIVKFYSNTPNLNNIVLEDDREVTIGRAQDNDIILNSSIISAHHAKVYIKNGEAYIEDLNSMNGTFLNGEMIKPHIPYLLSNNSIIKLATKDYQFGVKIHGTKTFYEGIRIGRASENDIVIKSPIISPVHAIIEKSKNGDWYIVDNNSQYGTYIDSFKNRIKRAKLEPNRILYLGNYKVPTNYILNFINNMDSNQADNIAIDNNKSQMVIGRDPNSDIYISHPTVSSKHALLIYKNGIYFIEDLKSKNGTFVNKNRITKRVEVKNGDEIQVGGYSFIFTVDNRSKTTYFKKPLVDGWSIEAKNITYTLPDKYKTNLLEDISFTVNPGEFVGLMGLSGAGKTTLLLALNGYMKPTSGTSLIDDSDVYQNYDRIKTNIGYVPQDDIIHPELTVKEALKYYAKLRLPPDITDKDIDELIDKTLKDLGLKEIENKIIGSPDTSKSISGGQRKRVNLAMELLADPKIIFLDEPTSGLSAVDTKMVMELLRKLADKGTTIIITIHQPSLDNYKIMDNVIVLSYGKLAYYGPTYPDSIEFFCKEKKDLDKLISNPDNALICLNDKEKEAKETELNPQKERNKKGKYWQNRYKESDKYKEFVEKRSIDNKIYSSNKEKEKNVQNKNRVPLLRQLTVFINRYLKIKLKDIANTFILIIQAPLIAIMIAMLFSEESYFGLNALDSPMAPTMLFVITISAVWFGTINSSREIVSEKAIFNREQKIGIQVVPYILSKFVILSILSLLQSIILVLGVELFTPYELGFGSDIFQIIFITFLTSLSGLSIGFLVSSISKSQAQALAFIPLVLLPMIIFGGGMISVSKMEKNDNKFAYYISHLVPTRWTLEEMIRIYDKNDDESGTCRSIYASNIMKNLGKINMDGNQDKKSVDQKEAYKRCIEKRKFLKNYYGIKEPVNKSKDDNSSSFFKDILSSLKIYIILVLFIVIPIVIASLILYKRGKVK